MLTMLMTLALGQGVCPPEPASTAAAQADAMAEAYRQADDAALDRSHRVLDHALACLKEPLSAEQAMAVHRAKALVAFANGETIAVRRSWAAVKTLDPSATPSDSVWPEGHSMWSLFEDAPLEDQRVELERAPSGGWRVDGDERTDVPQLRAFLLQGVGKQGTIVHSGYHYSAAEVPQLDWAELDPTARAKRRKRIHGLGTGLATAFAAGSVGALGVASSARNEAKNQETPVTEVEAAASRANTGSSLAVGLGVGAAAITGVTWAVKW